MIKNRFQSKSRSTLFLIEQLVAVAVFAVCAAVCVSIFIHAYLMANEARDIGNGLKVAKNASEAFKAFADVHETAGFIRGYDDGTYVVYFDRDWRVSHRSDAAYVLRLSPDYDQSSQGISVGNLSVERISGEVVVAFAIAASLP